MADEVELPVTTLLVNGERRRVRTEPDTPLLTALRNHLGLTGSRFGCGLGPCGACTVLVDGVPVPACDTPVWAAADRPVTTVEALAGHPVDVEFRSGDGNPPLGVGEMAQGPTAAAIGNALCHAIGVRVRTLPLTTENVVAAMPG